VVGNTIADALEFIGDQINLPKPDRSMKKILVTCHRRENWGQPLLGILRAIRLIVREHPGVRVVFPTHPNPRVHRVVRRELHGLDRVACLPPVEYPVFIGHLKTCDLVLTDSGGVHEEAAMLGKPVILLRSCTERSEGLIDPRRQMAGSNSKTICSLVSRQLTHPFSKAELGQVRSAFGIKGASQRIVDLLEKNRN
jgi:UDP-N-acetylglucosamine 2-epimerase (non-hydrolysing)